MKQNKRAWAALLLLVMSIGTMNAQFSSDPPTGPRLSYKRIYILDAGIGIGCPGLVGSGSSSWDVGHNRRNIVPIATLQLMTYSSRSPIGYGLFYYGYTSRTKHYATDTSSAVSEKISMHYFAPQVSYMKREAGFQDGIFFVNAGVGYAKYESKGSMLEKDHYKTARSAVACNVSLAYEYVFDSQLGVRMTANCLYSRIKGLHGDKAGYPAELNMQPNESAHLIVPSLEVGLSYYFQR